LLHYISQTHKQFEIFLLQTLVLTKWLAVNDKNMLPPYAHTTLGVGAFVINEKEEALVILEKFSHAPDFWKLPGGAVDVDEELTVAAEREVKVCVFFASFACLRNNTRIFNCRTH
jgi:hypothetical protein